MYNRRRYGSTKVLDSKKDLVLRELKRVAIGEITVEEVAERFGVSRSSLFNWMKRQRISIKQLRNQIKEELERRLARKVRKRDLHMAPPRDFIEFINLDLVRQTIINMANAGLAKSTITSVITTWYKLSKGFIEGRIYGVKNAITKLLNGGIVGKVSENLSEQIYEPVHPAALTPNQISLYIAKRKSKNYEINNIISAIQSIEKWTGLRLRPPGLEQTEYKGKFREAEIPIEARYLFLKYAKEIYPKDYRLIRATALLLFRGARREGLLTAEHVETITLKPMPEFLMETKFAIIRTKEKGKRGTKFEWKRPVPLSEARHILPYIPFSPGELKRLESAFKTILLKIWQAKPSLFNQDTKRYLNLDGSVRTARVFHLWRHTAARAALRTFHWNRYLVARLLGWEKSDNLQIYGDFSALQLLQEMPEERPPYMFLYGPWLQKAKKERLL